MRKKIAALALCWVALFAFAPMAYAGTSGDWQYEDDYSTTIKITGYTGTAKSVVIPDELDGKTVTGIGDGAFKETEETSDDQRITSVVIPDSVMSIGVRAFEWCKKLKTVEISEESSDLRIIETSAFENCKSLTSMVIPPKVNYVKYGAFRFCSSLAELKISYGVHYIGEYAFDACTSLTGQLEIPATITEIYPFAFNNCSLTSFDVSPDNRKYKSVDGVLLSKNGENLILYPIGRTEDKYSYTVPSSVITIEPLAFAYGKNLRKLVIPNSAMIIATSASGESIVHASENLTIWCREGSAAEEYCESKGLAMHVAKSKLKFVRHVVGKTVGDMDFTNELDYETDATLEFTSSNPEVATVDGTGKVTIKGKGTTVITVSAEANVLYDEMSDSYTLNVGDWRYDVLEDDPDAIEIERYAGKHERIDIPMYIDGKIVRKIANFAFYDEGDFTVKEISIPGSVSSVGGRAFMLCGELQSINVANDNDWYKDSGGVLFDKDKTVLVAFPQGKSREYDVPDTVKTIGAAAFGNCENLVAVKMPRGLTTIEDGAFWSCEHMEQVNIPSTVESIGEDAFTDCHALKSLAIPTTVKTIGAAAFVNCENLVVTCRSDAYAKEYCDANGIECVCPVTKLEFAEESVVKTDGDEPFTNELTCKNEGDLSFESSNSKVVTVDDETGEVTIKGIGTARITVTATGDHLHGGASESYSLTVKSGQPAWECTKLPDGTVEITGYKGEETSVSIPGKVSGKTVTSIGEGAFEGREGLTVTIPSTVTTIQDGAFGDCKDLVLYVPDTVTSIGEQAFAGCENLVVKGRADTMIANYCAYQGIAFEALTAELRFAKESVTKDADDAAFTNELTSKTDGELTFKSSNSKVATVDDETGEVTIKGIGTARITVTAADGHLYGGASESYSLTVNSDEPAWECAKLPDGTVEISGYNGGETSVSIPSKVSGKTVTSIGEGAFEGREGLTVTIPSTVTTIQDGAFGDCKDLVLYVPDTVTEISENAFRGGEDRVAVKGRADTKIARYCAYQGIAFEALTAELKFAESSATKVNGGEAFANELTCKTDGELSFESSNPKVATVDDETGEVTIKGIGAAKITVTAAKGHLYGEASESYSLTVKPKPVTQKTPATGKKHFHAKWYKSTSSNASGYQVKYSKYSSMKSSKTVTVSGYSKVSKKISKLKAKKRYYVQVRAYKTVSGKKYYSAWSATKSVKTK